MNIVIWDIETDSSNTFFGTIIEIGAILMNDNFKELDKLYKYANKMEERTSFMASYSFHSFYIFKDIN